jgi:hypothetical protein
MRKRISRVEREFVVGSDGPPPGPVEGEAIVLLGESA